MKVGAEVLHFWTDDRPMSEREMVAYLVHEDGWMRVPVFVDGPLLVRGFTDALYTRAIAGRCRP